MRTISRREFVKTVLGIFFGLYSGKLFAAGKYPVKPAPKPKPAAASPYPPLALIKGKDHAQVLRKAVETLGGMERFVKKGYIVVVKPNMSWDRTPEQAANTNPLLVKEIVKMCYEAGASKVKVFDRTCANPQRSYRNSGVAQAAREAGADVFHVDDFNFVNAEFDYPSPMQGWPVYRDAVTCDCFINLPVLKHHSLTGLTLSMKNLMGVLGGNRGTIHWNIGVKLAHITDFISPDLTIIDATRVLMRHGPSGGNMEDVKVFDTVIAGTDPVLTDSEAARLVGQDPMHISYIREAHKMGLGKIKR
jgi:uncharacterized protein (DUF362 family)